MQVVENWSDLVGVVEAVQATTAKPGYACIVLKIENMHDVDGYPNLINADASEILSVYLPEELCASRDVGKGERISCRIRLVKPGLYYLHSDYFDIIK